MGKHCFARAGRPRRPPVPDLQVPQHGRNETKRDQPGTHQGRRRRVTSFGRWMRRFKLDELPQFYNVLRGDMSLVGPRPKLPQYAAIFNMPYGPDHRIGDHRLPQREDILRHINRQQIDRFYAEHIKPKKVSSISAICAGPLPLPTFVSSVRQFSVASCLRVY